MINPVVWTIAGFDPAGLAGTLADIETLKNFKVGSGAIITAVTAQNAFTISAIEPIPSAHVAAQWHTLFASSKPQALKIGMLATVSNIATVANLLKNYDGLVVLDPVFISSSGKDLIISDAKLYVQHLQSLFIFVDVLTPNIPEAELLLSCNINSYDTMQQAAHDLIALGVKSVLLKGGHLKDDSISRDYWTNGRESLWLTSARMPEKNYRGTGCTLSSAIAANLALNYTMQDALLKAKEYVHKGISQAIDLDQQTAQLFNGSTHV